MSASPLTKDRSTQAALLALLDTIISDPWEFAPLAIASAAEQARNMIVALDSSLTASDKPAYLRGKRSIVSAAILLPDGTVLCGVRHLDKHMIGQLKAMGLETLPTGSVQGFVANDYEFEDRQSAWLIALRAGQFDPKNATGTQGVLYSEDLW